MLFDNTVDPATMANHEIREEFQQAPGLRQQGQSIRYSTTLSEKTVYYAQRLSDGSVLRVSNTQYTLLLILISLLQPILIIIVIAVALSVALASRLSKQIVKPINELDLEHPEQAEIYEELTPLLSKLYSQNRVIQQQMDKRGASRRVFRHYREHAGGLFAPGQADRHPFLQHQRLKTSGRPAGRPKSKRADPQPLRELPQSRLSGPWRGLPAKRLCRWKAGTTC